MILKSLSRKDTQFEQIVEYVLTDKGAITDQYANFTILQNILHQPTEYKAIAEAFESNDIFRKVRKNGVVMYHDILAFHQADSAVLTDQKLEAIARKYIELRGGANALCLCKPHYSEKHIHLHFLIHNCELQSSKNLRIDKKKFADIKTKIQQFQLEQFPEITHSYNLHRSTNNYLRQVPETEKEYQAKKHNRSTPTKGVSQKQLLQKELVRLLENTSSLNDFLAHYQEEGRAVVYYRKNELAGIIINSRKYRFLTLLRGRDDLALKFFDLQIDHYKHKEQESEREQEPMDELSKMKKRLRKQREKMRAKNKEKGRDLDRDDW